MKDSLAKKYLGKTVTVIIDRPIGSKHPTHNFIYEVNYGYIPNTKAPDGEELDVYYLGCSTPITKASGKCIAIIHRLNDNEDKLIVSHNNKNLTDEEIQKQIYFQERWFHSEIIRS